MGKYLGFFISIEGLDGSGKSTQLKQLQTLLEENNYDVFITQEPSYGKIGKLLREYLSDPDSSPYVDALLFAADRVEHYFNEIQPELKKGKIVLTDRYIASSLAYQGAQGVPLDWIELINSKVDQPDLELYLDISVETAIERLNLADRDNKEKFETRKYLEKISNIYKNLDNNLIIIDAEGSEDKITSKLYELIMKRVVP